MTEDFKPYVKEYTPEEIAQMYRASMDSVTLINEPKREGWTDEDWAERIRQNKEHLIYMLAKDFWTTEDLTPFEDAVK
jgi:hypothetical protein